MHLKPDPESPTTAAATTANSNNSNQNNVNSNNNNGNAIVRVESAADEGLDELFKAVMNDGQTRLPQQVPMRQRRLPPSFFRPPSAASSNNSLASGNHSRESSLDGGYQSGQTPTTVNNNNNNGSNDVNKVIGGPVLNYNSLHNGMSIIHPRANSSPAALQPATILNGSLNSLNANGSTATGASTGGAFQSNELKQAASNSNATNISHFRQMSYDLEQIRLPDGWEMSYTANGERYFLNHKEKTTTWEDPRKKMLEDMLHRNGLQPIIQSSVITAPATAGPQSPQSSQSSATPVTVAATAAAASVMNESYIDPSIVPLPDGWEQAQTQSGDIYFISHIDQTTTWFHPSIPRNLQMKRVQQQSCSIQLPPFQTTTGTGTTAQTNIPSELVAALKNMNTSCQTAAGVVGAGGGLTTSPVQSAALLTASANTTPITTATTTQNQHLRDLELERERMKQRQEELLQSSLLNSSISSSILLSSTSTASSNTSIHNPSQSNEQQQSSVVAGVSPSPFLLQQQQPSNNNNNHECHSRQESIDSGLDLGNSSTYSMPHTPDDFLRMAAVQQQPIQTSSGTNSVTNSNSQSNNNNNSTNNHATDDLQFEAMQISGLDLDSESMDFIQGLDMDLLSNVEELLNSNKDNIMTWL